MKAEPVNLHGYFNQSPMQRLKADPSIYSPDDVPQHRNHSPHQLRRLDPSLFPAAPWHPEPPMSNNELVFAHHHRCFVDESNEREADMLRRIENHLAAIAMRQQRATTKQVAQQIISQPAVTHKEAMAFLRRTH